MKVSTPKESVITAKALKLLKEGGILAWKNHGSLYSKAGIPDIQAVRDGTTFYIEMKRPGEEPTPIQAVMIEKLRKAGAPVTVAHSAEEAYGFVALSYTKKLDVTDVELAFRDEEAAIEKAKKEGDHRVREAGLSCPNCGSAEINLGTMQQCLACGFGRGLHAPAMRALKAKLARLDKIASGPAGDLVRRFGGKTKGRG